MSCKYNYQTLRNDYMTPPEVYLPLLKKFNVSEFDLDVCCSVKNIPAKMHFVHGAYDGLKEDWQPLNWMNPPFSTCEYWVIKAAAEQKKGNTTVSILPVRTESKFWQDHILNRRSVNVRFLIKNKKDGVTFIDPTTGDYVRNENGEKGLFKNALAIVIFKGVR